MVLVVEVELQVVKVAVGVLELCCTGFERANSHTVAVVADTVAFAVVDTLGGAVAVDTLDKRAVDKKLALPSNSKKTDFVAVQLVGQTDRGCSEQPQNFVHLVVSVLEQMQQHSGSS